MVGSWPSVPRSDGRGGVQAATADLSADLIVAHHKRSTTEKQQQW